MTYVIYCSPRKCDSRAGGWINQSTLEVWGYREKSYNGRSFYLPGHHYGRTPQAMELLPATLWEETRNEGKRMNKEKGRWGKEYVSVKNEGGVTCTLLLHIYEKFDTKKRHWLEYKSTKVKMSDLNHRNYTRAMRHRHYLQLTLFYRLHCITFIDLIPLLLAGNMYRAIPEKDTQLYLMWLSIFRDYLHWISDTVHRVHTLPFRASFHQVENNSSLEAQEYVTELKLKF